MGKPIPLLLVVNHVKWINTSLHGGRERHYKWAWTDMWMVAMNGGNRLLVINEPVDFE